MKCPATSCCCIVEQLVAGHFKINWLGEQLLAGHPKINWLGEQLLAGQS